MCWPIWSWFREILVLILPNKNINPKLSTKYRSCKLRERPVNNYWICKSTSNTRKLRCMLHDGHQIIKLMSALAELWGLSHRCRFVPARCISRAKCSRQLWAGRELFQIATLRSLDTHSPFTRKHTLIANLFCRLLRLSVCAPLKSTITQIFALPETGIVLRL